MKTKNKTLSSELEQKTTEVKNVFSNTEFLQSQIADLEKEIKEKEEEIISYKNTDVMKILDTTTVESHVTELKRKNIELKKQNLVLTTSNNNKLRLINDLNIVKHSLQAEKDNLIMDKDLLEKQLGISDVVIGKKFKLIETEIHNLNDTNK